MTARRALAVFVSLAALGYLLAGGPGVVTVADVAGIVVFLWLLVHGIDRLDRWARTAHPDLRIAPDERTFTYPHRDADVVQLRGDGWGAL